MNEIKLDRIYLMPMSREDWDDYADHVIEADEIYIQYGLSPTEELLQAIREEMPGQFFYSVYLNDKETMVGYAAISPNLGDVEYYIFKEYRGKGFGTEAVIGISQAYLNGTLTGNKEERLFGQILSENLASARVLEKAGFIKTNTYSRLSMSGLYPVQTVCMYELSA